MDEKERILIVDDDESIRRGLALVFGKKGYEVEAVGTGREALGKAQERFFNLALLDIRLPDMEGVELVAPLKEMHPDMVVIMATAYASLETAVRALNEGASAYVSKPLNMDEVLATVGKALEKQRLVEEKRRVEEALRIKDSAIASSINAIAMFDLEGNLTYVNDSFLKLCGYDNEGEVLGRPAVEFWQEAEKASGVIETLRDRGSWIGELVARRKDGSLFDVQLSASMVTDEDSTDEDGKPTCMMVSFVDITERKRLQERMLRQDRMAALGQLAGGVAHDFNNILTSITLFTQMLLGKRHLPPDLVPDLESILDEARRAAHLVQQILDFSRRSYFETHLVDLSAFIQEAADMLQRTLPENIRLLLEMGQGGYVVNANSTRMQQVLVNLATNARDAMPEGGELRIGLSSVEVRPGEEPPVAEMPAGEWVCLTISDTGTGIPPEVMSHLYEPFFTTKPVGEGTGLGLAQVHGIVTQHEGHVGVETEVGRGTTFSIYLPAHKAQEGAQ